MRLPHQHRDLLCCRFLRSPLDNQLATSGTNVAPAALPDRHGQLAIGQDFPAQRPSRSLSKLASRGKAGPNHHGPVQEPVRGAWRKRIDDRFQRGFIRDMLAAMGINKPRMDA